MYGIRVAAHHGRYFCKSSGEVFSDGCYGALQAADLRCMDLLHCGMLLGGVPLVLGSFALFEGDAIKFFVHLV